MMRLLGPMPILLACSVLTPKTDRKGGRNAESGAIWLATEQKYFSDNQLYFGFKVIDLQLNVYYYSKFYSILHQEA